MHIQFQPSLLPSHIEYSSLLYFSFSGHIKAYYICARIKWTLYEILILQIAEKGVVKLQHSCMLLLLLQINGINRIVISTHEETDPKNKKCQRYSSDGKYHVREYCEKELSVIVAALSGRRCRAITISQRKEKSCIEWEIE